VTPTGKTIKFLQSMGIHADVVERRITRTLVRDLFGVFDVLGYSKNGFILVQVTSLSNFSKRVKKVEASCHAMELSKIAVVEVHGWGKKDEPKIARMIDGEMHVVSMGTAFY